MGTVQNTDYGRHVAARLGELAGRHGVVGASVAVLHRDEVVAEGATGYAHLGAGIEATPDTVFQIGSVTKVWTGTLALRLVEEGLLELDAPIRDVLPELRLATEEMTARVTLRHLLTHTSGIGGDHLADTGRGDDNLEKFVAGLADVPPAHAPGATFSYCNAGFSLLGRVLEKVTGVQWDRLMRERLFLPLGLTRTGTLPEEALLHRVAIGHIGDPPAPAARWGLMRSIGPASLITSTPREVLALARLHLRGGVAPDGTRLLSAQSVALMQQPQVEVPDRLNQGGNWGLAWVLDEWDGTRVFAHHGNTLGQSAYLSVLPEHDLAVCLLTNGGTARGLYHGLAAEIVRDLAGVAKRPPVAPSPEPPEFDPGEYVGVYERVGTRAHVLERDGALVMAWMLTGNPAELHGGDHATEYLMRGVEKDVFVVWDADVEAWISVVFYALPDGSRYLHMSLRALQKVG